MRDKFIAAVVLSKHLHTGGNSQMNINKYQVLLCNVLDYCAHFMPNFTGKCEPNHNHITVEYSHENNKLKGVNPN